MKKILKTGIILLVLIAVASSCSKKKCDGMSLIEVSFFPTELENKSFSYTSGSNVLEMAGMALIRSKPYETSEDDPYCVRSARMHLKSKSDRDSFSIDYDWRFSCDACIAQEDQYSIPINMRYKQDGVDFWLNTTDLKQDSITINGKTYIDVYKSKTYSDPLIAEILYTKHYGIIQFTFDGTEVWQLKVD